jgi:hypothetical protein
MVAASCRTPISRESKSSAFGRAGVSGSLGELVPVGFTKSGRLYVRDA